MPMSNLAMLQVLSVLPSPVPVPVPGGDGLPAWAYLVGLFITGVLAPIAIGYATHLLRKGQRETKEAVEAVRETSAATARQVKETSTKRDATAVNMVAAVQQDVRTVQQDVRSILELLPKLVSTVADMGRRVDDLEQLTVATVGQVADSTVSSAVSFEELADTLDHIAPPLSGDGVRYCRRRHCKGAPDGCGWSHRQGLPEA